MEVLISVYVYFFQELLGNCGVKVHGFMGSHAPPGGFKTTSLAVCTIEKANGLINRFVFNQVYFILDTTKLHCFGQLGKNVFKLCYM